MFLVRLSYTTFLFSTISPSFRDYRCISLINRSRPACCFHWLRRLRRDHWSLAFSSPILRKNEAQNMNQQACPSPIQPCFSAFVGNFTVHFILVAAVPFRIPFSCEYLHIASSLDHAFWQIDNVPLICWCFVHLHVYSCTAVSIMQHNILFQHRPQVVCISHSRGHFKKDESAVQKCGENCVAITILYYFCWYWKDKRMFTR